MAKSVCFEELGDALQYFEEEQASNESFLNSLEERFQNDAFAVHIRRQTKAYDYAIRALRDAIGPLKAGIKIDDIGLRL